MSEAVSRSELAEALDIAEFKGDVRARLRELERRVDGSDKWRHENNNSIQAGVSAAALAQNHETRLRALERRPWLMIGGVGTGGTAIGAAFMAWLSNMKWPGQ